MEETTRNDKVTVGVKEGYETWGCVLDCVAGAGRL